MLVLARRGSVELLAALGKSPGPDCVGPVDLPQHAVLTVDDKREFAVMEINARGKGKVKWTDRTGIHTVFIEECAEHVRAVNSGA